MGFDPQAFRQQFPILATQNRFGKPLVYLDNAATTQVPEVVIQAIDTHFRRQNANIHRSVYDLGTQSELMYESTRQAIASYIHAASAEEIIFNSGATEGLNWIASQFTHLTPEDEILVTIQDHHSNILPWQRLSATVRFIGMTPQGDFDEDDFQKKLSPRTKVVSIAQYHNVLGTINPVKKIAKAAHRVGALCVVDGAQALLHGPINVQEMDCDFWVTSAHKAYGPTGIGFLYGKSALLNNCQPVRVGGGIVERVFTDRPAIFRSIPERFEVGTTNIIGVAGLRASIQFLNNLDWDSLQKYLHQLQDELLERLLPEVQVLCPKNHRIPIIAWTQPDVHPHDCASILDSEGIAVRAGHQCAYPLMQHLGITGCTRVSLAPYNTEEDIDHLIQGLKKIHKILGRKS